MTWLGPHGCPVPYFYTGHCVTRDACSKPRTKLHYIIVCQTHFYRGLVEGERCRLCGAKVNQAGSLRKENVLLGDRDSEVFALVKQWEQTLGAHLTFLFYMFNWIYNQQLTEGAILITKITILSQKDSWIKYNTHYCLVICGCTLTELFIRNTCAVS